MRLLKATLDEPVLIGFHPGSLTTAPRPACRDAG
jgi:hypothetical protein